MKDENKMIKRWSKLEDDQTQQNPANVNIIIAVVFLMVVDLGFFFLEEDFRILSKFRADSAAFRRSIALESSVEAGNVV